MIKLTLRQLFKNKALWAWPGIYLLFTVAMLYWGDIAAAENSYSLTFILGDGEIPSSMVMSQLTSLVVLFSIIGLPKHFAKNLTSERGSLLLSKPISRAESFFSDFASVCIVLVSYSLISVVLMAILIGIKAAAFPAQFLFGLLLFLPLTILTYYITMIVFLMLTESYLAGALLGWFVTGLSSLFLNSEMLLNHLGFNSEFAHTTMDVISYLIPSSAAAGKLLNQIYSGGFSAIDGGMLTFLFASCLPLAALSFYLYSNKEF